MIRRAVVVASALLAVLPASAGAATELNVIPHGQQQAGVAWAGAPGMLPATAQALMYDRLTPLGRNVTDAVLQPSADGTGYFKSARLLAPDDPSLITDETVTSGALSARIRRDAYGVPHIYSAADDGVIFGAGYATAADRSLLLDQARNNGIAGAIDVPGAAGDHARPRALRLPADGRDPPPGDPAAGPGARGRRPRRAPGCCATSTPTCRASTSGTRRTGPTPSRSSAPTSTRSTRSRPSSSARAAAPRSRTRCSWTPRATGWASGAARRPTRTCASATTPRRRPRPRRPRRTRRT